MREIFAPVSFRHNIREKMNALNKSSNNQSALAPASDLRQAVLQSTIQLWSNSRTSESVVRRNELIKKKQEAVASFLSLLIKLRAKLTNSTFSDG